MKQKNLEKNLLTENPKLASEWHPNKNGDLKPTDVTTGSGKIAWWQCKKGHEWEAYVYSRKKSGGCPICSNQKLLVGYNDLATTNPEIAKEWHPEKNGNLKPSMFFAGTLKKAWWQCQKCNYEWEAQINSRKQGHGCPECKKHTLASVNRENAIIKKGSLQDNYPDLAKQWHSTRNNNLKPSNISSKAKQKVWWQCEKGHEWEAAIYSRTTGVGCPICNKELRSSFPEQAIYYYLSKNFKNVINSYKISGQTEIDVYIEDINLGIEYDGEAWHKKVERDIRKNLICKEKNITLIRVREEKCPPLNDETFCIGVNCKSTNSLEYAIRKIYEYIDKNIIALKCVDINIDRDTSAINDLFINKIKNNNLLKTYPKIAKEWHPIKNGKMIPDMVTSTSGKKVWWLGKCGHEWQARIYMRVVKQTSCPICTNRQVLAGFNDLATLNPKLAEEWHPTKNGQLKPTDVNVATSQKAWWMCDKGHEWQASMNNRYKKNGTNCPYCANQKLLVGYNDLATIRPDLANEWHPMKNGNLKPTDIVPGYNKKVWWLCKNGHEWEAVVDNRYRGRGCPGCSDRLLIKGKNDLATVNPELTKEWHPTKNGNLKPDMIFPNTNKKAWWLGKCGHEWEGIVNSRNNGVGCPYCSGNKILIGFNDLTTINPDLAEEWHPTKNGNLKPTDVTKGSDKKVWWLCNNCGYEWERRIASRNTSSDCPHCKNKK